MNVKFYFSSTKAKFDALVQKNPLALYFITDEDTGCNYLYKGDKLLAAGHEATTEFAGLMSAEDKAKLQSLSVNTGDNVDSITFAGVEMTEVDGVFSIDKEAALNALGISVPEGTEGQETVIATEATVTQMSEELKAYVEEQLASSGADDGEI